MNSEDFEDLIIFSRITGNTNSGLISFDPCKGRENTIAELIKRNHLENISISQFIELSNQYMPSIQARRNLRKKKIADFTNLTTEEISKLSFEKKVECLETIFHKRLTNGELADFCSKNMDKFKALLCSIQFPKDFWNKEERQADRFAALIANNHQITDNMKNWQNLSLDDKKATIQSTAKVLEYVYGTPLEVKFYTSDEYRKENNLDEKAHVDAAYETEGKIFFNTDRLASSDNYMGVSVIFHEFMHKRQHETNFENPLISRLFNCNVYSTVTYEKRKIDSSLPEYGDIYSLMPQERHAYYMQKYVEDQIAEKTGIAKTQEQVSETTKKMHNKSFAMAAVSRYHSV